MASTVNTSLEVRIRALEQEVSVGVGSNSSNLAHFFEKVATYATGTGANQGDVVFSAEDSVANGAPDAHDIRTGTSVLTGDSIDFVNIILIAVLNESTTSSEDLQIGAGTAPIASIWGAAGDALVIGPGGLFIWTSPQDGAAVTATTADKLTITASTGTISYKLLIIGQSA